MGTAISSLLRFRLWAVLLLAAIGLQAGEPIRAPLERIHGSAFSAATMELALASQRRGDTSVTQQVPTPPPPPPVVVETERLHLAAAEPASTPRLHFEARGPPPRSHPARLPDSTAPPFA
ncbi:hypothetical protein EDF56_105137 [Novosphingobium sp. PhB165]|uniref:hypothetical protein n=1 Tax=Novosphingobium sp. PhB165 TaxID=2485105 RepID=UPI00105124F9|nr:hypothetical protein [Novosphingobium sp. PhB165]TCM17794.1 hypothetical protein EDF56_105137 [Novosphingobium sp. PhB165]